MSSKATMNELHVWFNLTTNIGMKPGDLNNVPDTVVDPDEGTAGTPP